MNIGFLLNTTMLTDTEYIIDLMDYVASLGASVYLPTECSGIFHKKDAISFVSEKTFYSKSDFLAILGGDGTILHSAAKAAEYEKPIIGINLGTLGYLTDVEKSDAKSAFEKVFSKQYKIEKRMMLEAEFSGGKFSALNDIYLSKGAESKMIRLDVYINEEYIDYYSADGIIFSTPTGSTAYNLSAGGPILKPDLEMIAITPICPHTLYARPFVISGEDVISVKIREGQRGDAFLAADGETKMLLKEGQIIKIKKSPLATATIKTNSLGFYEILRKKMGRIGCEKNEV